MSWTEEDLQRYKARVALTKVAQSPLTAPPPLPFKRPKYRNVPTVVNDIRFDSKLEADFYKQLYLRWVAKEILWFTRQVNFDLEGGVKYRADFVVYEPGLLPRVIDTTGMMTAMKILKIKQMKARWGIVVEVVRRGDF